MTVPVSDAFGWGAVTGRVVALLIAAQWAELRCVDHMAGQSPEGLPVVWRLVDHTAVLPTVAHMVEPQCAGLTAEQPS